MSQSNEELANELKGLLGQTGLATSFEGEETPNDVQSDDVMENPLETDFFKALNAFRAARTAGNAADMASAEERLRQVVRSELTGD